MPNLVSPSILSCDFLNIEEEISHFSKCKDLWLHLDIMDGHFVPNLTFGIPIVKQISKKTDIPLDAHLMVDNPGFHMEEMKDFGLENITFHIETEDDALALIRKYRNNYKSIGVSIKPKTDLNVLTDELLKELDLVLVMSVEPGFGGQSFIEDSLNRVRWIDQKRKDLGLSLQIQIDGGISDKNSKIVREAGTDNLVAGSYVFKAGPENYLKQVESLR